MPACIVAPIANGDPSTGSSAFAVRLETTWCVRYLYPYIILDADLPLFSIGTFGLGPTRQNNRPIHSASGRRRRMLRHHVKLCAYSQQTHAHIIHKKTGPFVP